MFNTLGSFSFVYFTLAAILFILILFEKYFIQLEDKIKANKKSAKKNISRKNASRISSQNPSKKIVKKSTSKVTVRRIPNNAA